VLLVTSSNNRDQSHDATPLLLIPQSTNQLPHLQVVTDASGAATATIDLASLPAANATRAGDSLEVKASWVGPTREAIFESATVK
jgi:hypothetical protein